MNDVSFETVAAGDAPVVRARIPAGGSLYADAGAMMAMSPNLVVESSLRGGVVGALSRSLLRGETFFYLTISAPQSAGEALLAPSTIGGIEMLEPGPDLRANQKPRRVRRLAEPPSTEPRLTHLHPSGRCPRSSRPSAS